MGNPFKEFLSLSYTKQIQYLKAKTFAKKNRFERIEFLKSVLSADLSSKIMASALKLLREMKYRDQLFFRQFLYHVDGSVAAAARKAISEAIEQKDSGVIKVTDILRREKGENRLAYLDSILKDKDDLSAEMLLSFLKVDDPRVRERLVEAVDADYELDEERLIGAMEGSVWYVRSALLEILRKRNSPRLLQVAASLICDPNVEVRLRVVEALGGLENETGRPYLLKMKKDPHIWVSRQVREALEAIEARKEQEKVEEPGDDEDDF